MEWGNSFNTLYANANNEARAAFNNATQATTEAVEDIERAIKYSQHKIEQSIDNAKNKIVQYTNQQAHDAAEKYDAVKMSVKHQIDAAKCAVDTMLQPQPAGAKIQPCPKAGKKQRVEDRRNKIIESKKFLAKMTAGKKRDALEHATTRFERNNVAVERARLASDVYNVGQSEPLEGWERVSNEELKKLNMTERMFPQLADDFKPSEYKDGYYCELYRSKKDVFGEERYVLVFRGTQGNKDWETNAGQAFGLETEHYDKAIETAIQLKKIVGDKLDIAGHSLAGGMATAAGIITHSPTYVIDPAGVHPATLERFGKEFTRSMAEKNVQNYVTDGEILDTVQTPNVQRSIATALGGVVLAVPGRRAVMEQGTITYGAAGPKYKVPVLINAKEIADGKVETGMTPGLQGRVNNNINPIQKVALHDPDYAIAGIEQQKADDMQTINKILNK
jgi:hypothetical protein